jgi:hypothetical protein
LKLRSPFLEIENDLITLAKTPAKGAETLGVVGFPSDKAPMMYEAWKEIV